MPTLQVRVCAENAGVGDSRWAPETIRTGQDTGGLTTRQIYNKVRECVWEIAQSMSSINKEGAGPELWDVLIDRWVTGICDLDSKRPLCTRYMADKTNLAGQIIKAAPDELAEVGLYQMKIRPKDTVTKERNVMHIGMYFIAPMLLLLFRMMCRYRRRWGRNRGSQVFTSRGGLRCVGRFPCWAI